MDYFTFNGTNSLDKGISLIDYNHIFLPNNQRQFIDLPGRDGSIAVGSFSKKDVVITCEIAITGENEEEILNTIEQSKLWLNKSGFLGFWDMPGRKYRGELISSDLVENNKSWDRFNIVFRCNPIKFGEYKEITGTDQTTITNNGTYKATGDIEITIEEETEEITVKLEETGERIIINHNFIQGDVVVIDLGEEKATKNGYNIMEDCYIDSDFFYLPPGNFTIKTGGEYLLKFTERWL